MNFNQVTHEAHARIQQAMNALSFELVRDLSLLNDDQLDELTSDGYTFASLEWFRFLDHVEPTSVLGANVFTGYAVVRERDVPVAICPLIQVSGRGAYYLYSPKRYYFEHWIEEAVRTNPSLRVKYARLFRAVRFYKRFLESTHTPLERCLFVASPYSLRARIAVAPSATTSRDEIHRSLIVFLQQVAARRRLPLCFFSVPGNSNRLSKLLDQRGFNRTYFCADNVIELERYRRFSDYLTSFPRSLRRALQREYHRSNRSAFELCQGDDFLASSEEIADVTARSQPRPGDHQLKQSTDFWRALGQTHRHKSEAIFHRNGEQTVGCHVLLRNERRGEMWSYRLAKLPLPFDRSSANQSALTYYEPIRRAISLGYRRLWLGPNAYESKELRGARQVPLFHYFWFPRRWDRWFLSPYLEHFGDICERQIELATHRPRRLSRAKTTTTKSTPSS